MLFGRTNGFLYHERLRTEASTSNGNRLLKYKKERVMLEDCNIDLIYVAYLGRIDDFE